MTVLREMVANLDGQWYEEVEICRIICHNRLAKLPVCVLSFILMIDLAS
jgi:hypothetical protein